MLTAVLKKLFSRPRPAFDLDTVDVGLLTSFPSGHASMSLVVWVWLAVRLGGFDPSRLGRGYLLGLAVLAAGLIGLSRLYLGVHHPTDVLAGWALGAAWVAGCWLIDDALFGGSELR